MKRQQGLRAKILFVMSIFTCGAIAIASLATYNIVSLDKESHYLTDVVARRSALGYKLESGTHQIRNIEKVFVLERTREGKLSADERLQKTERAFYENLKASEAISTESGKADLALIRQNMQRWRAVSAKMRTLSLAGRDEEASEIARGESRDILAEVGKALDNFIATNEAMMNEAQAANSAYVRKILLVTIALSVLVIAIGLGIGLLVVRGVVRSIDSVIEQLNRNSNNVSSAATQIASSSEELSQAATEQAASIQETSASVEEMSSMVRKNADNAKLSAEVSESSRQSAERGKQVVDEMVRAIGEINQSNEAILKQVDESNRQISEIVQVISEIGNMTKVINDIVFQTKLLSFNASVEAARAGEHGKGFAVVAEEVGNLAQMSGNAAKEIGSMLDSSIRKVEGIAENTRTSIGRMIEDARHKVDRGSKVAAECSATLEEIVSNVSTVSQMASEITSASREQAQGVSEINKAIAQLDQVTQTNAAASEAAASSAQQLARQADDLRSVVTELVQVIRGGGSAEHRQVHQPAPSDVSNAPVVSLESERARRSSSKKVSVVSPHKAAAGDGLSSLPSESDSRFRDF